MLFDTLFAMLAWAQELWEVWKHPYTFIVLEKIVRMAGLTEQYNYCLADLTNNDGVLEYTFGARFDFIWSFLHDRAYGTQYFAQWGTYCVAGR